MYVPIFHFPAGYTLFTDSINEKKFKNYLSFLPEETCYIQLFKPWMADILSGRYRCRHIDSYYMVCSDTERFCPAGDTGMVKVYGAQEYLNILSKTRALTPEIKAHYENVVNVQAVIQDGEIVSKCDVAKRSRNCYELNGGYTKSRYRRKGFLHL